MPEASPVAAVLTKHRPVYPDADNHIWCCSDLKCPAMGVGWGQWVEHADAMITEEVGLKQETRSFRRGPGVSIRDRVLYARLVSAWRKAEEVG